MNVGVHRARTIFLDAVERHEPDQWPRYLDAACGEDASLRRGVEVLLQAHARPAGLLDQLGKGPWSTVDLLAAAEGTGSSIGPYKLMEQIGEGGMGVVYVAEQSEPVRRKVALKIVKPGMDTRHVLARFEAERQALAMMDHPNIARVHDAGATTLGRPYFVMELVQGIPITEYCDSERLSIPKRLELFVLVCRAVQHAHQKGIIHRDLKPSNILVTLIDGVAVPKVIDFGIAKTTGGPLTNRTLDTGFAQLVGTPLYMSPEQADLSGVDVDTRSDVYALGVLLYELLTGTTPIDHETLCKAAYDEIRRVIREQEPPTPSTRLGMLGVRLPDVSARRNADPRHFGRSMRGELDWVVMKAIEKDRTRRYETANDFAADVMRYLTDQPVEACPPSEWYRFTKYARRNRVSLTTAALVGLALVVGTGVSLWQAEAARKAQHRAEAAEARAATEAAIARAVSDFLQGDLLGQAAGTRTGQDTGGNPYLTVKEALDRASARIGDRFQDQPLVEAAIRTTIGTSYNSLSENRLAVPHLERAVALRKLHLGLDHSDTLGSMAGLTVSYMWVGRYAEAIALQVHLVEARRATLGTDHPETLACVSALAEIYQFAGQWDVTRRLLEDLLVRQRAVCGPAHLSTLITTHQLARNNLAMDRRAESMALHETLLGLLETANGPRHESAIWPLVTFAQVCQRAGELDRADELLSESLEITRNSVDSPGRRKQIGRIRGLQALSLLIREQYSEAEPLAREAETAFLEHLPETPVRFYWMSVRGAALCGLGRYAEAEPLLLEGYEGMKQREAVTPWDQRRRLAEAGEWVVRYYEVTRQPRKAQEWVERLAMAHGPQ